MRMFGVKYYNPRGVTTRITEENVYRHTNIEVRDSRGYVQLSVKVRSQAVWRVARANVKLITKYNIYQDLQDMSDLQDIKQLTKGTA